jgi:hypothetical protein
MRQNGPLHAPLMLRIGVNSVNQHHAETAKKSTSGILLAGVMPHDTFLWRASEISALSQKLTSGDSFDLCSKLGGRHERTERRWRDELLALSNQGCDLIAEVYGSKFFRHEFLRRLKLKVAIEPWASGRGRRILRGEYDKRRLQFSRRVQPSDTTMMKKQPLSYREILERRLQAERFDEEHWLVQTAAWSFWASIVTAGTVCFAAICAVVVAAE